MRVEKRHREVSFQRTAVVLETQREFTLGGFTEYISLFEAGCHQAVTRAGYMTQKHNVYVI